MHRKPTHARSRLLPGASALSLALLTSAAYGAVAQAQSQELCAAAPQAVPFLPGSPCWDPTPGVCNIAGYALRAELNEPRWALSPRTNYWNNQGSETSNEGGYRIVRHGNDLYISLQSTGDLSETDRDAGLFAIEMVNGAVIRRVAVRLPLKGTSDGYVYTGADATFENWVSTGGAWTARRSTPSWLKSVAAWRTQEVNEGGADWAVQFKIDLTSPEIAGGAVPATAQFTVSSWLGSARQALTAHRHSARRR